MNLSPELQEHLDKLTPTQLKNELATWYDSIPEIKKVCEDLGEFKAFAKDANDLQQKIMFLKQTYMATIELKDKQIQQLLDLIRKYAEDPIGIGFKIEQLANTSIKLN